MLFRFSAPPYTSLTPQIQPLLTPCRSTSKHCVPATSFSTILSSCSACLLHASCRCGYMMDTNHSRSSDFMLRIVLVRPKRIGPDAPNKFSTCGCSGAKGLGSGFHFYSYLDFFCFSAWEAACGWCRLIVKLTTDTSMGLKKQQCGRKCGVAPKIGGALHIINQIQRMCGSTIPPMTAPTHDSPTRRSRSLDSPRKQATKPG